jgi:hypothetical protein
MPKPDIDISPATWEEAVYQWQVFALHSDLRGRNAFFREMVRLATLADRLIAERGIDSSVRPPPSLKLEHVLTLERR